MSSADRVTTQRIALELGTEGVSSVALARSKGDSVQAAAKKLSVYAGRGLLRREPGPAYRGHPYVYRVTDAGKRRLREILKLPNGADFGPLLQEWGGTRRGTT